MRLATVEEGISRSDLVARLVPAYVDLLKQLKVPPAVHHVIPLPCIRSPADHRFCRGTLTWSTMGFACSLKKLENYTLCAGSLLFLPRGRGHEVAFSCVSQCAITSSHFR